MKIRQVALVAEDLPAVRTQLFELLGIEEGFVDEAVSHFGLQNIVTTIGDTFLEIVSPVQEGTTAGRLLQRRGGDGGYMVIVQVEDCSAAKARLAKTDIRIVWEIDTGRARALHLHPRDVPGALPSLDEMDPPEAWYWAGPNWEHRAATHACCITAAEVQVDNPISAATRWAQAYNTAYRLEAGQPVIPMEGTEVRFVPVQDHRGEGLRAIDIRTEHLAEVLVRANRLGLPVAGDSVTICGTVFNFHR
jgi:hypothetical protein